MFKYIHNRPVESVTIAIIAIGGWFLGSVLVNHDRAIRSLGDRVNAIEVFLENEEVQHHYLPSED